MPEPGEMPPEEGGREAPGAPPPGEPEQGEGKPRRGASDDLKADLAKERRERQALQRELQRLKDRDLSELERAQRQAAEAAKRLEQLEAEAMRQRVALRAGIPAEHIHRLQGATEAELAADAAELAKLLTPKAPRPDPTQGARNGNGGALSMNDWVHQQLRGR